MWSTKPHSQREQITGGVLCCYTATEKLDYLLKRRHSRGSYRKGSGNKETQSSNMPREISGSNNILKPWFMGKRKKNVTVWAKKNNSFAYLQLLDFCIPNYMSAVCDSQVLLWAWKLTSRNFSLSQFSPPRMWRSISYLDSAGAPHNTT